MMLEAWRESTLANKAAQLQAVVDALGPDFTVDRATRGDDYPRIIYTHGDLVIDYRVMWEHTSGVGLSDECRDRATVLDDPPPITVSELTPYTVRPVGSFAVAETPLLEADVAHIVPRFGTEGDTFPAFVDRDTAETVVQALSARMLTEAEWEAMVKLGRDRLFPFGDELPSEKELDAWLAFDAETFTTRTIANHLSGLFFGEWCADRFTDTHASGANQRPDEFVVKGGGAQFWPWQDAGEWVWCMCAMRLPSGELIDATAALRPALSIPTGDTIA